MERTYDTVNTSVGASLTPILEMNTAGSIRSRCSSKTKPAAR